MPFIDFSRWSFFSALLTSLFIPSLHIRPLLADDAGQAYLLALEQTLQQTIARCAPSVVAIARVHRNAARDAGAELQLNVPGLNPLAPGAPLLGADGGNVTPTDFGSGVIISADGAILTCYHLLDNPEQHDYYVWLGTSEGMTFPGANSPLPARVVQVPAKVQAGDPWTDLAVLKIDAAGLPVMPMGDASQLQRGKIVIALGNPQATARDGQASASLGIVANLQRRAVPQNDPSTNDVSPPESLQEFGTLIQTDAKLHLGASGGALVNLQGEMIGLTTSLAALSGFDTGAGYAIPIDPPTLAAIAQLQNGIVPAFGFLGVEPIDAGDGRGALIGRVVPGLAADLAGLRPGDLVVQVENQPITTAQTLFRELSRRPADSLVTLVVHSPGNATPRNVSARLGKKRMALSRPSFGNTSETDWRGMVVDFSSALPPDRWLRGIPRGASEAAVLSVTPDSPTWNAGIRPGVTVFQVNGQPISRPEDFYRMVEDSPAAVELGLESRNGTRQVVTVAAPLSDEKP